MSDFFMSADFGRSQIAAALRENPEQMVWVLAEIARHVDVSDLEDMAYMAEPGCQEIAQFYRDFAALIDPTGF